MALLPTGDATQVFADFTALRKAKVLDLFTPSRATSQSDYEQFVHQTGFDYRRDLQEIAIQFGPAGTFAAARGRFAWSNMRAYAVHHGGGCTDEICFLPASDKGRFISFAEVQPDVLALAIGAEKQGVGGIEARRGARGGALPPQPVWMKLSRRVLYDPTSLPTAARIFVLSVQSAKEILLSMQSCGSPDCRFELRLDARCANDSTADTIVHQLRIQTNTLRGELKREKQEPSPADLTGLLTAGSFSVQGRTAVGTWPIHEQLLDSLR